MRDVEDMLHSHAPEPAAIQDKLDEIKSLIRDLNTGWRAEPPRAVFMEKASEAEELLARAIQQKPNVAEEGYDRQLAAIQAEGNKAYEAQNTAWWKEAFERLVKLCDRLEELAEPGEGSPPPDPHMLLIALAQQLAKLEQNANELGRYKEFEGDFKEAVEALKQIKPQAPNAMLQIRDWYFTKYENLRTHLNIGALSLLGRSDDHSILGLTYTQTRITHAISVAPEIPLFTTDRVHFSVTSPPMVQPSASFVMDVWAHLEQQRQEVIRRAREATIDDKLLVQSEGPVQVERGAVLSVHLKLKGITIQDPEKTILWAGEIGNARFMARVPKRAVPGAKLGSLAIYANGAQIARFSFTLYVGDATLGSESLPMREERHRKAFASYASEDRDEVLRCIQGILKAAPDLDIFFDKKPLRSGQDWEQELWKAILASHIFYLFWSENAAQSEWVEKEWRYALKMREKGFIDPAPLVSTEIAPPPPELADKHFYDWPLAYRRGKGASHEQAG
jgi:tetratricopeptide (TPR) repeat protein